MSGISTSSGGDVKLDGNPNAFTGTNSFNINLPTSSLTTTTANDEFITKAIGDTIYGSGDGDAVLSAGTAAAPQEFTGFNIFTNEIEQKDNSTDINSFRQTENSTAVGKGNFIEQDGVGKGHITQRADNSVIRQNGNDTQIIQGTATTTGAVFKQEGDDAEIKQEGIGVEFKQSSTFAAATPNIISTTGFVRAGQAPAIGDDCVNKTYFDANAGTGDVTQSGTNAFTGANSFNSTRPTTTILATGATAAGADDFICKRDGDALYQAAGGGGGSARAFQIALTATIQLAGVLDLLPMEIVTGGTIHEEAALLTFAEPSSLTFGTGTDKGYFIAGADDVGWWRFQFYMGGAISPLSPNQNVSMSMRRVKAVANPAGTTLTHTTAQIYQQTPFSYPSNPPVSLNWSMTALVYMAQGDKLGVLAVAYAPYKMYGSKTTPFTYLSGVKL
mgnify:CR=1 FL=1